MRLPAFNFKIFILLVLNLEFSAYAGSWSLSTFSNDFGSRSYRVFTPTHSPQEKLKLLLGLHGCLNPGAQFAGLTKIEALAEENKIVVIIPEQTLMANLNLCWNWHEPNNQSRNSGEPSLIMGIFQKVKNQFKISQNQSFIYGVSAGGSMTAILLATYPDFFKAGMIGSGTMYMAAEGLTAGWSAAGFGSSNSPKETAREAFSKMLVQQINPKRIPVLIFHGDIDSTAHPNNAGQIAEQFAFLNDLLDDGLENSSVSVNSSRTETHKYSNLVNFTTDEYFDSNKKIIMKKVIVHGMGHAWSGGERFYPYNFDLGPDETHAMWNFFSKEIR